MQTLMPSTAQRWKMATTSFFPFVVAAFAIRTKAFGRSAPLTSARPEDLRKNLRFMGSPMDRLLGYWVTGLLGYWVAWLLGCLVAWLLGCLVAGLLGCWVTRLLGCWVAGLLGCWVNSST